MKILTLPLGEAHIQHLIPLETRRVGRRNPGVARINLIAVIALSPLVYKITKNFIDRKVKKKQDVKPLLSYDSEIQAEMEKNLDE